MNKNNPSLSPMNANKDKYANNYIGQDQNWQPSNQYITKGLSQSPYNPPSPLIQKKS